MIYIGTNEYDEDIFLNFEDAGNIFVHGCPGMIKEQYLNTIYKMMKCEGSLGIVFWPFKPLELEPWCKDNLQEEAQGFSRDRKSVV